MSDSPEKQREWDAIKASAAAEVDSFLRMGIPVDIPFDLPEFKNDAEKNLFRGYVVELLQRIRQSNNGEQVFIWSKQTDSKPRLAERFIGWRFHIAEFATRLKAQMPDGFVIEVGWNEGEQRTKDWNGKKYAWVAFREWLRTADPFTKRCVMHDVFGAMTDVYRCDLEIRFPKEYCIYRAVPDWDKRDAAKEKACECLEAWVRWTDAQPIAAPDGMEVIATESDAGIGEPGAIDSAVKSGGRANPPTGDGLNKTERRVINCLTHGKMDERIKDVAGIADNPSLTVDEKLEQIGNLFPDIKSPAYSYGDLAKLIGGGVTRQAVGQSAWSKKHKKGQKAEVTEERHRRMRKRSQEFLSDGDHTGEGNDGDCTGEE